MPGYAAFLRGVNLGRRRRVSGAELRTLFEQLGFDHVATFRTSGNVVFAAQEERAATMAARIEGHLAEALGYEVAIFLRSDSEVRAIAEQRPFSPRAVDASEGKLQVSMLSAKPAARARDRVLALATAEDKLAFGDRELYWLPSGSMRESALDLKAIEDLLGPTTMRTKGTVELIAEKFFAD